MKVAKCELCDMAACKSAIIGEYYYKNLCLADYDRLVTDGVSSGQARYNRDRDIEEHEADIRQPWNGDGKPDAEFLKLYPSQARTMFGEDGMRAAERS